MLSKMEAIRAKVAHCIKLVEIKFGVTMPAVDIRFDLTGRSAGVAGRIGPVIGGNYYLRFNVTHMTLGGATWEHLLNDTVPHEVAHTVCQAFPRFGKNHNSGWKSVCLAIGGNGKRCYSKEEAPEAYAKMRPYTYTSNIGKDVSVSKIVHTKIQTRKMTYNCGKLGQISYNSPVKLTTVAVETAVVDTPSSKSTKTVKTVKRTVRTVKTSNAQRMRDYIAAGASFDDCVKFGVEVLGQKKSLAVQYIKVLSV